MLNGVEDEDEEGEDDGHVFGRYGYHDEFGDAK